MCIFTLVPNQEVIDHEQRIHSEDYSIRCGHEGCRVYMIAEMWGRKEQEFKQRQQFELQAAPGGITLIPSH